MAYIGARIKRQLVADRRVLLLGFVTSVGLRRLVRADGRWLP